MKIVIMADEVTILAEGLLAEPLPRRWRHVQSVARRARWVAKTLSLSDALVTAAWLHDIGYGPRAGGDWISPLDGRATCAGLVLTGRL